MFCLFYPGCCMFASSLQLGICCPWSICQTIALIYTPAAHVQFISLASKAAVLFRCCDFIIGIYLGLWLQHGMLASLGEGKACWVQRCPLPWEHGAHAEHGYWLRACLRSCVPTALIEFKEANRKKKAFFLSWQINLGCCFQLCNALDAISNENVLISVAA